MIMRRHLLFFALGALLIGPSPVLAHHSNVMFDLKNPIVLEGVVQEYKFTSPHTFIVLLVAGADGSTTVWNLEGNTPSALVRDGWSKKTLNAGDKVKMKIAPLRSGAPGGWWTTEGATYQDGSRIQASPATEGTASQEGSRIQVIPAAEGTTNQDNNSAQVNR
jgi:hypothetical protein